MTNRGFKTISILIPIWNEEENIPIFLESLKSTLQFLPYHFQLLFVNDGSTDNSTKFILDFPRFTAKLTVIEFSRNYGKETAIYAGLQEHSGDALVLMDADMQDPPHLIPVFLKHWEGGNPIVMGIRTKRNKDPYFKRITAAIFEWILQKFSNKAPLPGSGDFFLLDDSIVQIVKWPTDKPLWFRGIIAKFGKLQTSVYFERLERAKGNSKWTYWKLFQLAIQVLFYTSHLPLFFILITEASALWFFFHHRNENLFDSKNPLPIVFLVFSFVLAIFVFFYQRMTKKLQIPKYRIEKKFIRS
ncbi:glycosyltransferase family 2 protein [Leptospira sp. 96542]|nr:glycosyltransferase family 2 protein [Leptospira sp. 96542]